MNAFCSCLVDEDAAPEEIEDYVPSNLSELKTYEGYENLGFKADEFIAPPPPSYDPPSEPPTKFDL